MIGLVENGGSARQLAACARQAGRESAGCGQLVNYSLDVENGASSSAPKSCLTGTDENLIVNCKLSAVLLVAWLVPGLAHGQIGDPTLRTDHLQYAGEGAFQTVEDCVRSATAGADSAQDRAIAMYLWLLSHQWHLASPQGWRVPGVQPDTKRDTQFEMFEYDANRSRFSYGYGLCGTVHAWNEPYWKALGMNARRRAFPGHVNSEIEYDSAWHAFDTDMAGLVFRRDGVVAGYDDIVQDVSLATRARPPLPCYPFAWPSDQEAMRRGWEEVAQGGQWYKMYHSGYAAHPGVVHVRSGETFTRYFDRDHFGGPERRRFWHHQTGGPFRNWTFANQGPPRHNGAQSNSRGNASYCNGEFDYRPDLTGAGWREGVIQVSPSVLSGPSGLVSKDGTPASVTFHHFSPYVICGDPADDANPMTGPATGGLVIAGQARGLVRLEVSADEGQTWQTLEPLAGRFSRDATDLVKGRFGWRVRFSWDGTSGLKSLALTTVTQVCQTIYPRLKASGSQVVYRAAQRAVVPVLPNFGLPESAVAGWEVRALRSANVVYAPRTKDNRFTYQTTNNQPGAVVFRIDSPTDLVEVSAAVRFGLRVPPPANCDFRLELSVDGGKRWHELGRAEIPGDNEYSSGWMYGHSAVTDPSVRTALVRANFYQGGHAAGLIDAELYGLCRTGPAPAVSVTYAWRENGQQRQHQEVIPAGTSEHAFQIPTGASISDDFVRIAAAGR